MKTMILQIICNYVYTFLEVIIPSSCCLFLSIGKNNQKLNFYYKVPKKRKKRRKEKKNKREKLAFTVLFVSPLYSLNQPEFLPY